MHALFNQTRDHLKLVKQIGSTPELNRLFERKIKFVSNLNYKIFITKKCPNKIQRKTHN